MEISVRHIGPSRVEGMLDVVVDFYKQIDDLGHTATVETWIPKSGVSITEIETQATQAALNFLKDAITAHGS